MNVRGSSVLLVLYFFCASIVFVASQNANGGVCNGTVGEYTYDLQGLSDATGNNDVVCLDQAGNTYFYRPCFALQNQNCQTTDDAKPAVCQKDTRKIPQYHDCGSTSQVQWSPRPAGADTGFIIAFLGGGEDDRKADVEFICDPSAGVGILQSANPVEQPTHYYHLVWRTAYACPTNSTNNNGTLQCCSYILQQQHKQHAHLPARMNRVASGSRYTCDMLPHLCPLTLGAYRFAGNTTVSSCDQCGSPQRSCCFYTDPDNQQNITTQCVTNTECANIYNFNDKTLKLVGNTMVPDCDSCYF